MKTDTKAQPQTGVTYAEYSDAQFSTFEDHIFATVNGRRISIAIQRGGMTRIDQESNEQETYNLIQAMVERATDAPRLRLIVQAIAGLIGNVDHGTGNGANSARMRGDLLNNIRDICNEALKA